MSKRTPGLLLGDILLSMERIATYVGEMDQQSFASDTRTVDAVVQNLEIIGEAATRIPEEFKGGHREVPGRRVDGRRNRIVHEYCGLDIGIVWSVVSQDLPQLKPQIQDIADKLE